MSLKENPALNDYFEELKASAIQAISTYPGLNPVQQKEDAKKLEKVPKQELFDFLKTEPRTAAQIHSYLASSSKENPIKSLFTSKKKKAS